jgi:DUF2934 family protein
MAQATRCDSQFSHHEAASAPLLKIRLRAYHEHFPSLTASVAATPSPYTMDIFIAVFFVWSLEKFATAAAALRARMLKLPGGAVMDETLMLRIRERAYEIWTASGGDADENWLRAEAELLKNSNCEPISSAVKKKRRTKARAAPNVAH